MRRCGASWRAAASWRTSALMTSRCRSWHLSSRCCAGVDVNVRVGLGTWSRGTAPPSNIHSAAAGQLGVGCRSRQTERIPETNPEPGPGPDPDPSPAADPHPHMWLSCIVWLLAHPEAQASYCVAQASCMCSQEIHWDLLYGRGFRVLRGLPVPPAVTFECALVAACCRPELRLHVVHEHDSRPCFLARLLAVMPCDVAESIPLISVLGVWVCGHRRYAATALWGVSAHFGAAQSLTQAGHLLGHVRDSAGALVVRPAPSSHSQSDAALQPCCLPQVALPGMLKRNFECIISRHKLRDANIAFPSVDSMSILARVRVSRCEST